MKKLEPVDVLIIGSGAAGSAVARSLADSKLRIVCLEQGVKVREEEFPANQVNWQSKNVRKFSHLPTVRGDSWFTPIDDLESPIKIANYYGVGGSTILFSGHYPRFHEFDFKTLSNEGLGADWPITYSDLEIFYEQNRKYTPVAGLEGDPAYPPIKNLLPPVPIGAMGEVLADGFNKLGWHWWPSYSAIATRKFGHHNECLNVGTCNLGCPQRAKSSSDISYWIDALKLGVELREGCKAEEVITGQGAKLHEVIYTTRANDKFNQPSSVVVLACGGIATPGLMLKSIKKNPSGLSNSSNLVGKNLMLHPLVYVEGIYDKDLNSDYGPQGCCIASHEFAGGKSFGYKHRGFTMQVVRGPSPVTSALRWHKRKRLKPGTSFFSEFKTLHNRTSHITVITEDLPENTNRVTVHRNSANRIDVKYKVEYKLSDSSKKALSAGTKKAKEILQASGAKEIIAFAPVADSGWHIMGTVRMGQNRQDSVVDAFGESHDDPGIFVADSSVFVTSSSVNPTATIHALALRCAERIKEKYGISK